jgi:hypothetical protein
MRAYIYDEQPGHQTLRHDSGNPVSPDTLRDLGVLTWYGFFFVAVIVSE